MRSTPLEIHRAANTVILELCPTAELIEHPVIRRVLSKVFHAIFRHVPAHYNVEDNQEWRGLTVPLYDALDNCGQTIYECILALLYDKEFVESGHCYELRKQLQENEAHMNGLSLYGRRSKAVPEPYERDEPPGELCRLYFKDTPFLDFFQTPVPFIIPRKAFGEHGALFARSGHGKTTTLRTILAQLLQEKDPPALFLIDSLGSLIEGIAELEIFSTRLKDRLVILDPSDPKHMPSLNFFNLHSDDLVFYLFKAIEQSFTERQATMVSYLMELMRKIPDASLMTLINLCKNKENLYPDAVLTLSPFAQAFFETEFYAKKPDGLVQQTKNQVASRLFTLARIPKFDQIFSSKTGVLFDPFRFMQEKKICLINTDARAADKGGLGAGSAVFGRLILALCLDAARSRPKDKRHLALLIVDEAKAYLDENTALILSDARQFGMGMLLCSQFPHQLHEGVRKEINTNTAIRMMAAVEHAVASQYARDMFTTPEFIMRMKSQYPVAEWAAYIANVTEKAIKLTVPLNAIEKMPKTKSPAVEDGGTSSPADIQRPPEPAAKNQQQNELSLRDTDLPLPDDDPSKARRGKWKE